MNRIKELRNQKRIKQTELAKILSVAPSTLSYWERGEYEPSNETIIKLASFFETTTDYLLGNTDDPSLPGNKKYNKNDKLNKNQIKLLNEVKDFNEEKLQSVIDYVRFVKSSHN